MRIRTLGWAILAGLTMLAALLLGIRAQTAHAEHAAALQTPAPPDEAAPEAIHATWDITRVDTAGNVGQHTSVVLDGNWETHVAYYDVQQAALKYAHRVLGEWTVETVDDSGDVGQYASIALDWNDRPGISYYDATTGALKVARWTQDELWLIETIDDGGDVGQHTSLAFDNAHNYPHVSYYDASGGFLNYAYSDGTFWYTKTLDSGGDVGQYTSLALNTADEYYISYYDVISGDLKLAYLDDIVAKTVDIDTGTHDVGKYSSLVLNGDERPLVSYYDDTQNQLRIASWITSTWVTETVDEAGAGGAYASLALDESDDPYVSYVDADTSHLKLVRWTGTRWLTETVDGVIAQYTSLALDRNENAHISYYEASPHDDLKYAYIPTIPYIDFASSRYYADEGGGSVVITASLSSLSADQATVDYTTLEGTATAGSDYISTSGTLTFAPGTSTQSFSIGILQDEIDEQDETIIPTFSNPTRVRLGDSSAAEVVIVDDDITPEVAFQSPDFTVREDEGAATLTVVLTQTSSLTIMVDYATNGGSAYPVEDYTPVSGTLVFTPGVILQDFDIPIKEDDAGEGEETIQVTLSNPHNTVIGANNPAILTITEKYRIYLPVTIR